MTRQILLHANCVARPGADGILRAILLRGASGSGKSDLSLRLMAAGWYLVADDQTILSPSLPPLPSHMIAASCPPAICGLIEIRGFGILKNPQPIVEKAWVVAAFDLLPHEKIERYPDKIPDYDEYFGLKLPKWSLCGFDAAAVAKIEFILAHEGAPEGVTEGVTEGAFNAIRP